MGVEGNNKKSLHFEFEIKGGDFAAAGDASSKIKKVLQQIGADHEIVRRVAVSCYEAEMNVVIHARRGQILFDATTDRIEILVKDEGPGIEDIDQAMQPGFSTAPDEIREMGFGAGMGLPNIKNCSSNLEITSEPGVGTNVRMVFENV